MMTAQSIRKLRTGVLALALVGLGGCASSGGGVPKGGGDRKLEIVGNASLTLQRNQEKALEVRYFDENGERITDGIVDFGIEGQARGAALSSRSTRTDDVGIARVGLQAGDPASFKVVAVAAEAAPVTFNIEVREVELGELEYTVTYPGNRRLSGIEAALFTNTSCAHIEDRVPAPKEVERPRLDRTERFKDVQVGVPLAIYALGMTSSNTVAAEGCQNGRLEEDGGHVTVTLQDTTSQGGLFDVEERYDIVNGSFTLQIMEAMLGLASDPAGWIVDWLTNSGLAPDYLQDALEATGPLVASTLDEFLDDEEVLPEDYQARLQDVHDDFRAALGEMTFLGELEWQRQGRTRDEFDEERTNHEGVHRVDRVVFPLATDRPIEYRVRAETELMVGVRDDLVILPEHELNIPVGHYIAKVLEDELLPRLPGNPHGVRQFVDETFDCPAIISNFDIDTEEEELARDVCMRGEDILGDAMARWLDGLARDGDFHVEGEAFLDDLNRDYVADELYDGDLDARWSSSSTELTFDGDLEGKRVETDKSEHPVLERIRDLR